VTVTIVLALVTLGGATQIGLFDVSTGQGKEGMYDIMAHVLLR
jgi:hypothetical protein